jgi:hypothetical protein
MKYINNRESFIEKWKEQKSEVKLYEAFDMAGGSGPMGNDINWGDSLVGRLFNSVFRKIGIGKDLLSINNVISQIKKEFESMVDSSKLASSNINASQVSRIHISYLLQALTNAVHSGTKIIILKSMTEETIDIVDESKLEDGDKTMAIKELEDFLDFLNKYEDENIGEDLSDELTGIDSEEEKKESTSSSGWGSNVYSGMVTMLKRQIDILNKKDDFNTTDEGKKEDSEKADNIQYVLNRIIEEINRDKDKDKKFKNNLLTKSKDIAWPILEISDDQIIYRKVKKIVELKDGQLLVTIPKYDETNKKWTGEEKPRLIEFNKKNIINIANYIISKISDLQSTINSDKDFILNEKEVAWFNQAIKGSWLVMPSHQGNVYKTKIGACSSESKVEFLTKPVSGQAPTNVNSIVARGTVFKTEEEAKLYYDKIYKSGGNVLSNKGAVSNINKVNSEQPSTDGIDKNKVDPNIDEITRKGKNTGSGTKDDGKKDDDNTSESFAGDYFLILEAETLSKEEDYVNQALERLKSAIDILMKGSEGGSKDPKIDSKYLESIVKEGSKKFMKRFASEIKKKYDQVSDKIQENPLYRERAAALDKKNENINLLDYDIIPGPSEKAKAKGELDRASEKIARFASVTMLFVGEDLYSSLGELGKSLNLFNNEFQKLISTEFTITESVDRYISKYGDFVKLNEKKTSQEISEEIKNYYDQNISYDKWIVKQEEVDEVDEQIRDTKISKVSHDSIIQIVKLFNKAYKIYTTEVIPSGRKGGKVSNRVYREYEYLGTSGGPQAAEDGGIKPGFGPFRNKKIFNKFESAILDVIKDTKYKEIFSENVKVGSEKSSGNGKILLKFINNLLDGSSKLYMTGAQQKFIEEYFGLKVDLPSTGPGGAGDSNKKTITNVGTFEDAGSINLKREKTFYQVADVYGEIWILFIVKVDKDGSKYLKISKGSYYFDLTWNKEIKVDTKKEKKIIYFIKTDKDEITTGEFKYTFINLNEWVKDEKTTKKGNEKISISSIKALKTEKGEIFKLSGITTSGESPDTNKYDGLINKLQ